MLLYESAQVSLSGVQHLRIHRTGLCDHQMFLRPPLASELMRALIAIPGLEVHNFGGHQALLRTAVRLYPADGRVALAEGIESALAVRLIWGWPTWACLCANGLRAIELPPGVEAVRIYADADDAGLHAAYLATNWLRGEGRCVEWVHSSTPGVDPLDVWNATHGVGVPK